MSVGGLTKICHLPLENAKGGVPYETDYRTWQHQARQSLVHHKNVLVGFCFKGLCSLLILHVFVCCFFFTLLLKETAVCLP